MKPFISVVMKPTLGCNIRCAHCYHPFVGVGAETMGRETLERVIRLVSEEYESAWFVWHGGEPMLLPRSFYKDALSFQKKYFGKASRCGNTIQTNGTALTPRFMDFCRSNRINVSVSTEGPYGCGLRDGVDDDALSSMIDGFVKKERKFIVNATVHSGNVGRMMDMYDHFNTHGVPFSFCPVTPLGNASDGHLVADEGEYVSNSIAVFDKWLRDTETRIPVMPFFQCVMSSLSQPNIADCAHSSCLGKWICVYPDGNIFPCGKPCPDSMNLGNINNLAHVSDAFKSEGFREILAQSVERRDKCKGCDIFDYCKGGCSIDALADGSMEDNGGYACRTYRAIFLHIKGTVEGILRDKPDLGQYNMYVRDAIMGGLMNPLVFDPSAGLR